MSKHRVRIQVIKVYDVDVEIGDVGKGDKEWIAARTEILAEAYRKSEQIRGDGDAQAAKIYADAFGADKEFYSFTRSLKAYQNSFQNSADIMVLNPDSEFFKYFKGSAGGIQ